MAQNFWRPECPRPMGLAAKTEHRLTSKNLVLMDDENLTLAPGHDSDEQDMTMCDPKPLLSLLFQNDTANFTNCTHISAESPAAAPSRKYVSRTSMGLISLETITVITAVTRVWVRGQ